MLNFVKDNAYDNESVIRYKLFSSLITGGFVIPDRINLMLNQLGIQFGFTNYFVTNFYLTQDCKISCEKAGYNVESIYAEIKNTIENQCKCVTYDYVTFTNIDRSIITLAVGNLSKASDKMVKFYESTLSLIRSRYNINIIVGKSENCSGIEKFKDAFCEALQQTSKQEYYGYRETVESGAAVPNEMFMDKQKSLIKSIKACDVEKAKLIIDWICDTQRRLELPLKQIKTMNALILNGIVTILSEINCDNVNRSSTDDNDIFEEMNAIAGKIRNFEDSKQVLRETTCDIIKVIEKFNLEKKKKQICLVLNFIEKNYSRNITLCEMAEKFEIDCVSLGKAFRENLGENFSRYLIKYRINKAKELLSTTNLKVYEIGKNVGYCDVKYFTRLFKSFEGVTPKEYRKSRISINNK